MQLGVWLPIVSSHPGSGPRGWQADGTAADLVRIAQAAESFGYDCLCTPEHVAVPIGRGQGTVYWDPLTTLGFLAAATSRTRLAVLVAVLGYHHPLELAKRYGTLQRLAGQRVVMGLGVGGTEQEFRLLGAEFQGRGALADERIQALRAAMGTHTPTFAGPTLEFTDFVVEPSLALDTPIWVGGGSAAALRRALQLGDGWAPTGLRVEELRERSAAWTSLEDREFEVVFLPRADEVLDPLADTLAAAEYVEAVESAGATLLLPRLASHSADHYVEQLEALAELVTR